MPYSGPTAPVAAPPLFAPPTGLLQAATVVEHALLQTTGNLAFLVGPDAPDTVLAAAIVLAALPMLDVLSPNMPYDRPDDPELQKLVAYAIEGMTDEEHERLRADTARALTAAAVEALVASPEGGLERGGSSADPLDHWGAGISWSPESVQGVELADPCTDVGTPFSIFDGARVVTDGATTNTSTTLTSLTAQFSSLDVGRKISGAGIQALTTVVSVTDPRTVVMSLAATATATGVTVLVSQASTNPTRKATVTAQPFLVVVRDSCGAAGWQAADYAGRAVRGLAPKETIAVEQEFMHGRLMGAGRTANTAADGHLTNGSAAITSATADFTQADVGRKITSNIAGVAANTTVTVVTDAHTATMSANFTGSTSTVAVFTVAGVAAGTNRYLSDDNCQVYNTGAVDPTPVQALAYANEVIARSAIGQGMIHVSAFFAEVAKATGFSLVKDSRGRLVTLNGNIVVPGNGYDGVGPDGSGGSADDSGGGASIYQSGHSHEWIYVSDIPVIWRPPAPSLYPATLREALDTAKNTVSVRAQRLYEIEWSALLQVAIKVNVLGS